ncbi:ste20-like kinase isoform X2 [Oratosquilla oratoria]|uniref:ste20-like kinase isoform X2 n=1 Tax=Oratosquilla oratoria TaxID=337810 RepID=UPI003F76E088
MSCLECPCSCSRLAALDSPDCGGRASHGGAVVSSYRPLVSLTIQHSSALLDSKALHVLRWASSTTESIALVPSSPSMVSFEPSSENYDVTSHLGTSCGGVGSVWVAKHRPSCLHIAVKIYDMDKCGEELDLIREEISTVRQLRHPNIVHYLTTFTSEHHLWILMPLQGFGSASHLVATHFPEGLSEQHLALIVRDVLHGLCYLHSKAIIHRAVRGSHILIGSDGHCSLSGLRHSTSVIQSGKWQKTVHFYPPQAAYNLNWASPELLEQDLYGYSEKSDIYSLGITICELGNSEVPYRNLPSTLLLVEKLEGRTPCLRDSSNCQNHVENGRATDSGLGSVANNMMNLNQQVNLSQKSFSQWAHNLVSLCLHRLPQNRPSAPELLQHSFIKQTRRLHATLPQLLHPLLPMNEHIDSGDSVADLLEDNISQLSLNEEFSWNF